MITPILADLFAGLSTGQIVLLFMALAFGFYMAWNIGANDVANAMGTSVGSRTDAQVGDHPRGGLRVRRTYLVGSNVSETVRKGFLTPSRSPHWKFKRPLNSASLPLQNSSLR